MDYRGRSNIQCPHCGEWSMVQPDLNKFEDKVRNPLQSFNPFLKLQGLKAFIKAAATQELVCQSCGKRAHARDCSHK